MRLFLLSFVFLAVLSSTAQAQSMTGRGLGKANCDAEFPCPNALQSGPAGMDYYNRLVAESNMCVRSYFSLNAPDGFFEQSFPDGAGCLTRKRSSAIASGSVFFAPQCCITPLETKPGVCKMVCNLKELR